MKLSLKRRLGFIHVRGGRFLRVAKTHRVFGHTASMIERSGPTPDTFAQPGDLAIEIVKAKRSEPLVGYAYLSGSAISLHNYDAKSEWFEPARAVRIEVSRPRSAEEGEALVKAIVAVKYGYDAGVFAYRIPRGEGTAQEVARYLGGCYNYERVDGEDDPTGHVFGIVENSDSGGISLHFQPKGQTSDVAATQFQIKLTTTSKHLEHLNA